MTGKYKKFVNRLRLARLGCPNFLLMLLLIFPNICAAAMSVADSRHNLSASGPSPIKAISEGEICIFCHTPHRARFIGLLWNRQDSTATYIPYDSTTITSLVGQPTGSSRLCLSCHDGTIALGAVVSRASEIDMVQRFLDTSAKVGTDLSDDHPISFVYDSSLSLSNLEYKDPSLLIDKVSLDNNNELQCTSCHDPHDDSFGRFLTVDNIFSALCLHCHQPTGWDTSIHKLSAARWNGAIPDPWPHTDWITVDSNACENCHRPHHAGGRERLLNKANEEDNCYSCHNGNVAVLNIQSEISKTSSHPVAVTVGIHDPTENFLTMQRHVECVDCHNPHQVNSTTAIAPSVNGRLAGISGVSATGSPVTNASYEYEVCFKCHAESAQGAAPVPRQILEMNTRSEFDLSNPSFHPVVGPRQNPEVPSLLPQYNSSSVIYCTDCHNNDNGPGAGNTGPAGPHGSQNPYLLERQYVMIDNTIETPDTYALCYKCHDRNIILGDGSGFPHSLHVLPGLTGLGNAPCSVCHDPHGISNAQGNVLNNSSLINFDTSVVFPDPNTPAKPAPEFEDTGSFHGACTLSCHTVDHSPRTY